MSLSVEPGAPAWARRLAAAVSERFEQLGINRPVRVPEVAAAAELPRAAEHRSRIAFVKALNTLAVSDGVNWRRVDTGATL